MHYSLAIFALAVMVEANPVAFPQAVTAAIAPPEPAPSGCTPAYVGSFAIVAQNLTATPRVARRQEVTEPVCGQNATLVISPVRQYIDGQIQGALHTETITYQVPCPTPVTQIGDGQIQNPVVQIEDGQIQNPVTQIGDGQIQNPVGQIGDGQIQNPVGQIGDGQVQSPVGQIEDGQVQNPVGQIGDGQVQNSVTPASPAPAVTKNREAAPQPTSTPSVAKAADAQLVSSPTSTVVIPASASAPVLISSPTRRPAPPSSVVSSTSSTTGDAAASRPTLGSNGLESCAEGGALAITLEDGILKDQQGRTGYIAANYQFQFDGPPQAGAIITAGFSVCANGSLALGGSNVFYQCLSGSFYNLYDRYWAAQCSPVTIDTINLKQC